MRAITKRNTYSFCLGLFNCTPEHSILECFEKIYSNNERFLNVSKECSLSGTPTNLRWSSLITASKLLSQIIFRSDFGKIRDRTDLSRILSWWILPQEISLVEYPLMCPHYPNFFIYFFHNYKFDARTSGLSFYFIAYLIIVSR